MVITTMKKEPEILTPLTSHTHSHSGGRTNDDIPGAKYSSSLLLLEQEYFEIEILALLPRSTTIGFPTLAFWWRPLQARTSKKQRLPSTVYKDCRPAH